MFTAWKPCIKQNSYNIMCKSSITSLRTIIIHINNTHTHTSALNLIDVSNLWLLVTVRRGKAHCYVG